MGNRKPECAASGCTVPARRHRPYCWMHDAEEREKEMAERPKNHRRNRSALRHLAEVDHLKRLADARELL